MAYDLRLATTITEPVDRRLRMFALIKRQPLSHVLSVLLDQALPPADELAGLLREQGRGRGSHVIASPKDADRVSPVPGGVSLGMTAVCAQCGAVYWVAQGYSCRRRDADDAEALAEAPAAEVA